MAHIVTLTLNPALDIHQFVDNPQLEMLNRAASSYYSASGKGLNVSNALSRLGRTSSAVLPLGGLMGAMTQSLLGRMADRITPEVAPIRGETRCNLKVNDLATGALTEFNDASPTLKDEEWDACRRLLFRKVSRGDHVILSGSLPGGLAATVYADLIRGLTTLGAHTYLDTSGPALEHGVEAGPRLVKPNRHEAAALLNQPIATLGDALTAARAIQIRGVPEVILSLGAAGALFLAGNEGFFVAAPTITPRTTNGCGDALLAGYLYATLEGWSLVERARYAVATATARALANSPDFPDGAAVGQQLEALSATPLEGLDPNSPL